MRAKGDAQGQVWLPHQEGVVGAPRAPPAARSGRGSPQGGVLERRSRTSILRIGAGCLLDEGVLELNPRPQETSARSGCLLVEGVLEQRVSMSSHLREPGCLLDGEVLEHQRGAIAQGLGSGSLLDEGGVGNEYVHWSGPAKVWLSPR